MTDTRVATPDGAELAVTITGDGPPLLLVPGLGATRVVFEPIIPLLAAHLTTIVYDQRGIGESQFTPGPYTTELLAADADAVLTAVGVERAAVLGASFGGMVAQQLAVNHEQRISRLVLAATGPGQAHLIEPPDPAATNALLGRGARSPEEAYRIACTVLYSDEFQANHADVIDEQVRQRARRPVDGRAFRAQLDASRQHDAWDGLARVTTPTLVIHGSADRVMPLPNARALAERIPGAELVVFDGAGHLFFHEQSECTAELVRAFTQQA